MIYLHHKAALDFEFRAKVLVNLEWGVRQSVSEFKLTVVTSSCLLGETTGSRPITRVKRP